MRLVLESKLTMKYKTYLLMFGILMCGTSIIQAQGEIGGGNSQCSFVNREILEPQTLPEVWTINIDEDNIFHTVNLQTGESHVVPFIEPEDGYLFAHPFQKEGVAKWLFEMVNSDNTEQYILTNADGTNPVDLIEFDGRPYFFWFESPFTKIISEYEIVFRTGTFSEGWIYYILDIRTGEYTVFNSTEEFLEYDYNAEYYYTSNGQFKIFEVATGDFIEIPRESHSLLELGLLQSWKYK